MEAKIRKTWITGGSTVRIVAQCDKVEEKDRIMVRKSKLKGTNIFIENDTTWRERRKRDFLYAKAKQLIGEVGYMPKLKHNCVETDKTIWY